MQLFNDRQAMHEKLRYKTAVNARLTHHISVLKRGTFAAMSEKLTLEQQGLLHDSIDADISALSAN